MSSDGACVEVVTVCQKLLRHVHRYLAADSSNSAVDDGFRRAVRIVQLHLLPQTFFAGDEAHRRMSDPTGSQSQLTTAASAYSLPSTLNKKGHGVQPFTPNATLTATASSSFAATSRQVDVHASCFASLTSSSNNEAATPVGSLASFQPSAMLTMYAALLSPSCATALWSVVLSTLYLSKRKLVSKSLVCVGRLLSCVETDLAQSMTLYLPKWDSNNTNANSSVLPSAGITWKSCAHMSNSNSSSTHSHDLASADHGLTSHSGWVGSIGECILRTLSDCLTTLHDSALQACVLDMLENLLMQGSRRALPFVRDTAVPTLTLACLTVATRSAQDMYRRAQCQSLLDCVVVHVVRGFVQASLTAGAAASAAFTPHSCESLPHPLQHQHEHDTNSSASALLSLAHSPLKSTVSSALSHTAVSSSAMLPSRKNGRGVRAHRWQAMTTTAAAATATVMQTPTLCCMTRLENYMDDLDEDDAMYTPVQTCGVIRHGHLHCSALCGYDHDVDVDAASTCSTAGARAGDVYGDASRVCLAGTLWRKCPHRQLVHIACSTTKHVHHHSPNRHHCADCSRTRTPSSTRHGGNYCANDAHDRTAVDSSSPSSSRTTRSILSRRVLAVLQSAPDGRLPLCVRELVSVLRLITRFARIACGGAAEEGNNALHSRSLALNLLHTIFTELPMANSSDEHVCALWLSMVLHTCRYDLMGALVRGLSIPWPFACFEAALKVVALLLRKVHYPLAYELHTLLAVLVFPLAAASFADFRHKLAVLRVVHTLLRTPYLCLAYFINYDCNPYFDTAYEYGGGMLQLLIDLVTEMTFLDYLDEDSSGGYRAGMNHTASTQGHTHNSNNNARSSVLGEHTPTSLTLDQQRFLRCACVTIMHDFTMSMYRWLADDTVIEGGPADTAHAAVMMSSQQWSATNNICACGQHGHGKDAWTWSSNSGSSSHTSSECRDADCDEDVQSCSSSGARSVCELEQRREEGNAVNDKTTRQDTLSSHSLASSSSSSSSCRCCCDRPLWWPRGAPSVLHHTASSMAFAAECVNDTDEDVDYHWKHIHHLRNNKRIAQRALQLVNRGDWEEAMDLLESRGYVVEGGVCEACDGAVGQPRSAQASRRGQTHRRSCGGQSDAVDGEAEANIEEHEKTRCTPASSWTLPISSSSHPAATPTPAAAAAAAPPMPSLLDAAKCSTSVHCTKHDDKPARADVHDSHSDDDTEELSLGRYVRMAHFLHRYPGVHRTALSAILEKVNKNKASVQKLLQEYFHQFHYHKVPIDVAFRDTTCSFMSWDRPTFEAQVWETIQDMFGAEYARQNCEVISAKDADAMAGVLLFLHANQHNESARSMRMTMSDFVSNANACLDIPFEPDEMAQIFTRVSRRPWQLDELGRTPQQIESGLTGVPFSTLVMQCALTTAARASARARSGTRKTRKYLMQQQQQQQPCPNQQERRDCGSERMGEPNHLTTPTNTTTASSSFSASQLLSPLTLAQPLPRMHPTTTTRAGGDVRQPEERETRVKSDRAGAPGAAKVGTQGDGGAVEATHDTTSAVSTQTATHVDPTEGAFTARRKFTRDTGTTQTASDGKAKAAVPAEVDHGAPVQSPLWSSALPRAHADVDYTPRPVEGQHRRCHCCGANRNISAAAAYVLPVGDDLRLLDVVGPDYRSDKDTIRFRLDHQLAYTRTAQHFMARLDVAHKKHHRRTDHGTHMAPYDVLVPYAVPHYAEHIRPIFLSTHAHITACVYMGLRVLDDTATLYLAQETYTMLHRIAAALAVPWEQLRPEDTADVARRYLTDCKAYRLLPPTRAAFVSYLYNTM